MAFPFSDAANPWVERLTGGLDVRAVARRNPFVALQLIAVLAMATAWYMGLWTGDFDRLKLAAHLSYICLSVVAFMAPAAGAESRRKLEFDPAFPDSLQSPLPDGAYLAALRARVTTQALGAALLAFMTLAGIWLWLAMLSSSGASIWAFRDTPFDVVLGPHPVWKDVEGPDWAWRIQLLVTGVVAAACYTAGYWMRATLLASLPARDPSVRLRGGLLTLALVASAMASLTLRLAICNAFVQRIFPGITLAKYLLLFATIEGIVTVFRLLVSHAIWQRLQARGLDRVRAFLFEGDTNPR